MSTVFVFAVNVCSLPEVISICCSEYYFVMNVCSLPGVISICCSEFYFAVTVVGHRSLMAN